MATHTKTTHDGRRIRFNEETNRATAYARRDGQWVRVSMKSAFFRILLVELKEDVKKPKITGLVKNIREEQHADRVVRDADL